MRTTTKKIIASSLLATTVAFGAGATQAQAQETNNQSVITNTVKLAKDIKNSQVASMLSSENPKEQAVKASSTSDGEIDWKLVLKWTTSIIGVISAIAGIIAKFV